MLLYSTTPLHVWMQEKEETKTLMHPDTEKKKSSPLSTMKKAQVMVICAQSIFAAVVLYATISSVVVNFDTKCLKLNIVIWSRVLFAVLEFGTLHCLYLKSSREGKLACFVLIMLAHTAFLGVGLAFALECEPPAVHGSVFKIMGSILYIALHYGYICIDFCIVCFFTFSCVVTALKANDAWLNKAWYSIFALNAKCENTQERDTNDCSP